VYDFEGRLPKQACIDGSYVVKPWPETTKCSWLSIGCAMASQPSMLCRAVAEMKRLVEETKAHVLVGLLLLCNASVVSKSLTAFHNTYST
jgi:hypothetical protein